MTTPLKGAIIVADGTGKVTYIDPTSDNDVFVFDSAQQKGGKFINIKNILPNSMLKVTATDISTSDSTVYNVIMNLTVPGETTDQIQGIKILSKMDNSLTSYDVRVYDTINGLTIAEKNFTNTGFAINDMGTLSNLPASESIFEVQVRRNGGSGSSKSVYLKECTLDFKKA